jgi:hypothetical protein
MQVKSKDVVRDGTGTGRGRANKFSQTLQSLAAFKTRTTRGLRPRAAGSGRIQAFLLQEINNTPRSVVGRAHTGEHHENTRLL